MQREAIFAAILETAPCGIAVLRGPELVFEMANPAYLAAMGGRQVVGRPFAEVHPHAAGQLLPILREVARSGAPFDSDEVMVDAPVTGAAPSQRYVALRFRALPVTGNELPAVLVVALETTENVLARRRAEALAALGARMNSARSLPEVVELCADDARQLLGGSRAFALLADSEGDRLRGSFELTTGERVEVIARLSDLPATSRALQDSKPLHVAAEETGGLEAAWLKRAGLKGALCVPMTSGGHLVGVLYVAYAEPRRPAPDDLTFAAQLASIGALAAERARAFDVERRAHTLSERASDRLQLLAESGAALAYARDWDAVVRTTAQLPLGYLADIAVLDLVDDDGVLRREAVEYAGSAPSRGWPPIDHQEVDHPALLEVLASTRPRLVEVPAVSAAPRDPDSALLAQLGASSCILAPLLIRHESIGVLTVIRRAPTQPHVREDVTLAVEIARRAALALDDERLLAHANDELRRSDEFLAIAAHELRTPLAAAQLQVDHLALFCRDDAALHPRVDKLKRSVNRLSLLLARILDVTTAGAHDVELRHEVLDLTAIVQGVAAELDEDFRGAGSELRLDAPRPVIGQWDRAGVESIVMNLLSNAAKFGGGMPVEVRVVSDAGVARTEVQDHGVGIEPEFQERMFGRYTRGVPARQYGGLGLGLWIARRFAEAHGGRIRVESAPGRGAKFIVELPLEPPPRF